MSNTKAAIMWLVLFGVILIWGIAIQRHVARNAAATAPATGQIEYLEMDTGIKIMQIQTRLQQLGYDLGPAGIDGLMGDYTIDAVWQELCEKK